MTLPRYQTALPFAAIAPEMGVSEGTIRHDMGVRQACAEGDPSFGSVRAVTMAIAALFAVCRCIVAVPGNRGSGCLSRSRRSGEHSTLASCRFRSKTTPACWSPPPGQDLSAEHGWQNR
jgi:hypothetical protein